MNKPVLQQSQRGGVLINLIILLMFVLLCAVVYLARYPLMRFFGETWIVQDPIQNADAILVLGDDNFYGDCALRAAELFRKRLAATIVASGRRLRPNVGMAPFMEHDLVERGVPQENIIQLPHQASSTAEEAEGLARLAETRNWHRVLVVTSNYRTRRVRYIFERIFPAAISVNIVSASDADFDPDKWWEKRQSIKALMSEIGGMVVAMWELRSASEPRTAPQGVVQLSAPNRLYGVSIQETP